MISLSSPLHKPITVHPSSVSFFRHTPPTFIVDSAMNIFLVCLQLLGCASSGSPHAVRNFMGYNLGASALIHPQWGDASFNTALASLRPGMLRFPSGTYGNCWSWRNATTVPPCGPTPVNGSTLSEFKTALVASGAAPIFMLNLITSSLDEQLAMLGAAQAEGLFVDEVFVELGNEFYFGQYLSSFKDGTHYGKTAAAWITAISAVFPRAAFAVVATPSFGLQGQRPLLWNGQVFAALQAAGISNFSVTMHEYHSSALNCSGCDLTSARVSEMLSEPAYIAARMSSAVAALPNTVVDVWVTEFSLNMNKGAVSQEARVFGSWASGLFSAATAILYSQIPRVGILGKHALLGDASAGALFDVVNGFDVINSVDVSLTTTPMTLSASGFALSVLSNASTGAKSALALTLSPAATLIGTVFGENAVVANLGAEEASIPAGALPAGVSQFVSATADPLVGINATAGPNAVIVTRGTVDAGAAVAVAPFSVTSFTVPRQ